MGDSMEIYNENDLLNIINHIDTNK
jgi:hypothetical protein